MAKIKRYTNGDACPCCGQVIQNKTMAELERFSVLAAAVMMELDPGSLLTGYGEDPMEVHMSDLRDALADFLYDPVMSIYIKGMEMPKSCWSCPFSVHHDPDTDRCLITGMLYETTWARFSDRQPACPLVPVPEHGRLIDADALAEASCKGVCSDCEDMYK